MKQTLKNRLLTFLAFSGVSIGVTQIGLAQDGFGIIKPVKPAQHTKTADSQIQPIPIVSASQQAILQKPEMSRLLSPLKPSLNPQQAQPPIARDNTPLAFAPSQITQASYTGNRNAEPRQVENGFAVEESQQFPTLLDPAEATPPILSPAKNIPPIVSSDLNELPPIVSGADQNGVEPSTSVVNPVDTTLVPMIRPEPTPITAADSLLPPVDESTEPGNVVAGPSDDDMTAQTIQEANYSTAGIPIRASASLPIQVQDAPPIVSGYDQPSSQLPPIVAQVASTQDLSTQEVGALPSASDLPMIVPTEQLATPRSVPLISQPEMPLSVDPNYAPATLTPPQSMAPMSTVMDQGMSLGQGMFSAPMSDAPVIAPSVGDAGCTSCDQGSVSGCGSCGAGGCYDLNSVTGQFNACGSCSNARRYLIAEALYFDRDDGFIANSNFGSLGNFDFNAGWRFTLGSRQDSTRGREISYMGTLPMDQNRSYADPGGIITSRFIPTDGFTAAQTSGFFNATQMSEAKQTSFHSLEFNRVRWGWDVLKTYMGVRYIMVDDSYTMFSQSIAGDQGFFQQETMNHMIGPHIGAELFYDVGYRLSFSFFSKFGVYANFNELDTVMFNNGVQRINNEDRGGTLSTSYEAGLIGHYRLNRQARFRFGYNILYLGEVASVSDNFSRALAPSTGSFANDSDDMFFHGLSIGFEIYR